VAMAAGDGGSSWYVPGRSSRGNGGG
jgi:hypothetical protein